MVVVPEYVVPLSVFSFVSCRWFFPLFSLPILHLFVVVHEKFTEIAMRPNPTTVCRPPVYHNLLALVSLNAYSIK